MESSKSESTPKQAMVYICGGKTCGYFLTSLLSIIFLASFRSINNIYMYIFKILRHWRFVN